MYLIIMEVKYGSIYTDDHSCNSYYIIKLYSYPYTLQGDLSNDERVISSVEMVCQGTYLFKLILILVIMFYKELNTIIKLFL